MSRLTENKIILITRKTRLDDLITKFVTLNQAKFYVEHLGADFSDYQNEHNQYQKAVREAEMILQSFGRTQVIERSFLTNFIFGKDDLVVTLGQDGLVANVLKYLDSQVVIGINPDPARWDGVLLPFETKDLKKIIPETFEAKRQIKEVTMAKATLNNGQSLYGVNDIFIGPKSHTSIRYVIEQEGKSESHSSSGIIVSTGLGSTGWFKSILTGANGISSGWSGKQNKGFYTKQIPWDTSDIYYSVREPFPSNTSTTEMVFGSISKKSPLTVLSQMPENGVIFSDGIEADFLEFNSGVEAKVEIADKRGYLVN